MEEKILKATHEGRLTIGAIILPVAVLDDGTRIISRNAIFKAFGRTKRGRAKNEMRVPNMPSFIDANNLQPFINNELGDVLKPLEYFNIKGKPISGYKAEILPMLCNVYLDARNTKKPNGMPVLTKQQLVVALSAEILMRSLSIIGIIALIDEATGYQDERVKAALNQLFNKILLDVAKQYRVTFPLDLYKQWFRLKGWEWRPENAQKRPGVIGRWTNDLIYARIAPGILNQLKTRNPKNETGHREYKHFQFLTDDIGEPRLREFFGGLIALSKATSNWRKYIEMVNRAYPRYGDTLFIPFDYDENE